VKRGGDRQTKTLIKYERSTVLGGWIGAEGRMGMKYFPVHECIVPSTRPGAARAEAENFPLSISDEFRLRSQTRPSLQPALRAPKIALPYFLQEARAEFQASRRE